MEIPTDGDLIDRIETKAMRPEWFDGRLFQMLRDGNQLWYRNPNSDRVIKITVEELPASEFPSTRPL